MKTFADISENDFISKIEKITHDHKLAVSFAEFSQDIRKLDQENAKPNFLKTKEEKKDFINKVQSHSEFNVIKENTVILKELINNDFFEFLLPYVIAEQDIDGYKNIELIGLGFYETNQDILSE
jgi:hypothetical protein